MLEHELISLISEANENLLFGLNLVKHKSSGVVMNTTYLDRPNKRCSYTIGKEHD